MAIMPAGVLTGVFGNSWSLQECALYKSALVLHIHSSGQESCELFSQSASGIANKLKISLKKSKWTGRSARAGLMSCIPSKKIIVHKTYQVGPKNVCDIEKDFLLLLIMIILSWLWTDGWTDGQRDAHFGLWAWQNDNCTSTLLGTLWLIQTFKRKINSLATWWQNNKPYSILTLTSLHI